jgi:hypothetical protein
MPLQYHYSPLVHLPPILEGGLSQGEVATLNLLCGHFTTLGI